MHFLPDASFVVSSPRSPARSQTLVLIYIYNTELSIIFSTDLYVQHWIKYNILFKKKRLGTRLSRPGLVGSYKQSLQTFLAFAVLTRWRLMCISISIFLESVLKNFETHRSEITDCVKKFLKYAPDRKGNEI